MVGSLPRHSRLGGDGQVPFQADRKVQQQAGNLAGQVGFEKGWSIAKNHRNLMGQASSAIKRILPAKQIIEDMMNDCLAVMHSHGGMIEKLPDVPDLEDIDEPTVPMPPPPAKEFTMEEIAAHNKKGDSWVVVNGKVLDLSKFQHPGGSEPITMYAGKDASEEFNMMHAETMIYKNVPQAIIGSLKADSKL